MNKRLRKRLTAFALAVMIVSGSLFSETLISEAAGSNVNDGITNLNIQGYMPNNAESAYWKLNRYASGFDKASEPATVALGGTLKQIFRYVGCSVNLTTNICYYKTNEPGYVNKRYFCSPGDSSKFGGYQIVVKDTQEYYFDTSKVSKPTYKFNILIREDENFFIYNNPGYPFSYPLGLDPSEVICQINEEGLLYNLSQDDFDATGHSKAIQLDNNKSYHIIFITPDKNETLEKLAQAKKLPSVALLPKDLHAFAKYEMTRAEIPMNIKKCIADAALAERWSDVPMALEYDLDGGTLKGSNPDYYYPTEKVVLKSPKKAGYTFYGWEICDNILTKTKTKCIPQGVYLNTIERNTYGTAILKAKWIEGTNQNRIYYHVGDYGYLPDKDEIFTYDTKTGLVVKEPHNFTNRKPGYDNAVFQGWYLNKELTRPLKDNTIKPGTKGDVHLYAKWLAEDSNIKYVINGGKNNTKNPTTYKTASGITLKNPTRKGYTFQGWYLNKKCTKKLNKNKIAKNTGDVTVYAKWKLKTYKINYKLNKGKNSKKNPAKYTVKTKNIKLKNPTRKGYTFKGWYSNKKLTKKVTVIKKGTTGNKTLYAKWKKK